MALTNKEVLELVPSGYFHTYLRKMEEWNNEMPFIFHLMSIMVVLGNKLGFGIHGTLDRGVEIFPNINTILLSPAGKCRRGEGSKFAAKVARGLGMNVHEGRCTPEGLMDKLSSDVDVLLYVEELSVLFSKRDFLRDIIPFLTKVLLNSGGQIDELTRTNGVMTAAKANLSCIFTTAPDWFLTTIPEEAFGGGLMSRFMPVYMPDREVIHVDIGAGRHGLRDGSVWSEFAMEMQKLVNFLPRGYMEPLGEAEEWFNNWYHDNENKVVDDDRMDPHRNRAPANVLRLAMILAVSNGEKKITKERCIQAEELHKRMEASTWQMYGYTDNKTRGVDSVRKRIYNVLSKGVPMAHAEFLKKVLSYAKSMDKLKSVIGEMMEMGEMTMINKAGQKPGDYPPAFWQLTDKT